MSLTDSHAVSPDLKNTGIVLPEPLPWPVVACSHEELERLRAAWKGSGPEHKPVADEIAEADAYLQRPPEYPPEGGQHNQWYQCEACQIGLETVDPTHHKCPKCETVYSGYPYDNVLYKSWHGRNAREMTTTGWAYAVTGEAKYAERAREMLLEYATLYRQYPYHSNSQGNTYRSSGGHIMEQTLSESSWVLPVCDAFDLLRKDFLTDEEQARIREGLLLPLYENVAKHKAGRSNWQTYHNAAILTIGAVLGEVNLVRQALQDEENGFLKQMEISVLPGGMWYENSWGYHFYPLEAVRRTTETARYLGIDLYQIPQTKQMYTVALDYLMADGTLPRTADATTTRIPGQRYETAYHQWGDEVFLEVLSKEPTWDSVKYGRTAFTTSSTGSLKSILKEGAGHAILRSYGKDGPASVSLSYGPYGGGHGHFDKLSFVYFALGEEQGYDPGRARSQAYRLPIHKNWYKATTSHNTVLIDRASQEGVEGHLEFFLAGDDLSAVAANVDEAYENVLHRRLLAMRPGYVLVVDIVDTTDGESHTFDWMYHNVGDGITSEQASTPADPPEGQGFEFIEDCRRGTADGRVVADVANGEGGVRVTVAGEDGSDVMIGTGPGESVLHRVPLVYVTRTGSAAQFAATLDAARSGEGFDVSDVSIAEHPESGWLVTVSLSGGGRELYAYDPDGARRSVEGIGTDAKLVVVRVGDDGAEVIGEGR